MQPQRACLPVYRRRAGGDQLTLSLPVRPMRGVRQGVRRVQQRPSVYTALGALPLAPVKDVGCWLRLCRIIDWPM